jgi:hypothetical protein
VTDPAALYEVNDKIAIITLERPNTACARR